MAPRNPANLAKEEYQSRKMIGSHVHHASSSKMHEISKLHKEGYCKPCKYVFRSMPPEIVLDKRDWTDARRSFDFSETSKKCSHPISSRFINRAFSDLSDSKEWECYLFERGGLIVTMVAGNVVNGTK